MEITFLGATGTVTGSKYLVRAGPKKALIDCGLFQGFKQLRLRNWEPLPVSPKAIDAVVLTHAHIDHSGYVPLLIRNGFTGKVYCSEATRDLCGILLPDCGRLQEEEAAYANRHSYSKHRPALPLYTEKDAQRALRRFAPVDYRVRRSLGKQLHFELWPAGHILGSAFVRLSDGETTLTFSGDLGRPQDLILREPTTLERTDYLVLESTYGNRRHDVADPLRKLADVVKRTVERGGVVLIPAFAVGRAQTLLYCLHRLKAAKTIPDVPVFLDSPMATDATEMFRNHQAEHRLTAAECEATCRVAHYVTTVEESKALSARRVPMILISASGMATGGRVLHHLKAFAPDARNMILFSGYQAGGTRGAALVAGAREVKIHGEYIPVRAEVGLIENLSAHADYAEILYWLRGFTAAPREVFLTHGEPEAADALRRRITEELGWNCHVPAYRDRIRLE